MTLQQVIELLMAAVAGGALAKIGNLISSYRKSSVETRILEAKAEKAEDANERQAITFALETLKTQVAEFVAANRALQHEHLDCRKALLTIEAKYEAQIQATSKLEKVVHEQGLRISTLTSLLEKYTDATLDEFNTEQTRIEVLTASGSVMIKP